MPKSSIPRKGDKNAGDFGKNVGELGKALSDAFGGILGGFSEIIERLGELAEKGEELKKGGEFKIDTNLRGKEMKGVYGVSIKTGIGGEKPRVEPFGNIRTDKETGRAVVQEVREPMVDVFEEEDHVLIVAEMPGVDKEDLKLDMEEDVLTLSAESGKTKYRKEVLLPTVCDDQSTAITGKNGIMEIKCMIRRPQ